MKPSSPARSDRYENEAFMKINLYKSKLEWYRGLRLLQEAEFILYKYVIMEYERRIHERATFEVKDRSIGTAETMQ